MSRLAPEPDLPTDLAERLAHARGRMARVAAQLNQVTDDDKVRENIRRVAQRQRDPQLTRLVGAMELGDLDVSDVTGHPAFARNVRALVQVDDAQREEILRLGQQARREYDEDVRSGAFDPEAD